MITPKEKLNNMTILSLSKEKDNLQAEISDLKANLKEYQDFFGKNDKANLVLGEHYKMALSKAKDTIKQRNHQIADLRGRIKLMDRDFKELRDAFFNNTLSQKDFIGIVEEIVQRSQ